MTSLSRLSVTHRNVSHNLEFSLVVLPSETGLTGESLKIALAAVRGAQSWVGGDFAKPSGVRRLHRICFVHEGTELAFT